MNRKIIGKNTEDIAFHFLESAGYQIIERNYRHRHGEIDLIGLFSNALLIFFEVKFRKSNQFGYPENFVSEDQRAKILETADHYINCINWQRDIRFDILSIQPNAEVLHFQDAFY